MALVTLQADPVPANNSSSLGAAFLAANAGDIIELQPGPAGENWDLDGDRIGSTTGVNRLDVGITLRGQDLGSNQKVRVTNGALFFTRVASTDDLTIENLEFGKPSTTPNPSGGDPQRTNGRYWIIVQRCNNLTMKNLVFKCETVKDSHARAFAPFHGFRTNNWHRTIFLSYRAPGIVGDILLDNVYIDIESDPAVDRSALDTARPEDDVAPNWGNTADGTHTGNVWHSYAFYMNDARHAAKSLTLRKCSFINSLSNGASIGFNGPMLLEDMYVKMYPKNSFFQGLKGQGLNLFDYGPVSGDAEISLRNSTIIADSDLKQPLFVHKNGSLMKSASVTKVNIYATPTATEKAAYAILLNTNNGYVAHNKLFGEANLGYVIGRSDFFGAASGPVPPFIEQNAIVGNNNSDLTVSDAMIAFGETTDNNVFAGSSQDLCVNDGGSNNLATGCGSVAGGLGQTLKDIISAEVAHSSIVSEEEDDEA